MEIIENRNVRYTPDEQRIRNIRTRSVIPQRTRMEVENLAWFQTLREIFSRDYNPLALIRRHHELQKSRWRAQHGSKPSSSESFMLVLRGSNPLQLLRQHYLDNLHDHMDKWERQSVRDINNELERLGRTPLKAGRSQTFRMLRSLERMIDNLSYPGGPDLKQEQVKVSTYNYIFAAPYDRRFANLTPEELCRRLEEAGVSETELQVQPYENILSGQSSATCRIVPISGGKAYALRPVQPFTLIASPDGTFPLQIHPGQKKGQPLQERKYAVPPPQKTQTKQAVRQNNTVKPGKKTGRGCKPRVKLQ